MDGQDFTVAGRIVSVRYLSTRDKRQFASAVLGDVSGQLEVMVWPRVFTGTSELWQEDNEVVVWGRVRVKDDRVQLNCNRAAVYQPGIAGRKEEPVLASVDAEPSPVASLVPEPEASEPGAEEPASPAQAVDKSRVVVTIDQTSDREQDIVHLRAVMDALREFPGQDIVWLRVANNGNATDLSVPNVDVGPELRQRLVEMVGEDKVSSVLAGGVSQAGDRAED